MPKSNFIVRGGADFSGINTEMQKTQTVMTGFQNKIQNSMSGASKAFSRIGKIITATFAIRAVKNFVSETTTMYSAVKQNETKLATIMRQRMNANNGNIKSMLDFMKTQQEMGVVGADAMAAGAQELATYTNNIDALKTIIPVLNNIATQQYGINVTAEQMQTTATMLGKVMDGQLGGLSRWGYSWTAAEEAILENGTAMEKAATIAKVVTSSVGEMNYALANTDVGRQKQLANTFADIKVQFGAAFTQISILFLPALKAVADALTVVANIARQVTQYISMLFGKQINQQAASQQALASSGYAAADAQDALGKATKGAGKAAKGATAPFDEINNLIQSSASGAADAADEMGGIGAGGIDLGGFGLSEAVDTTWIDDMVGKLKSLIPILEPAKSILDSFLDGFNKKAKEINFDPIKNLKNIGSNLWEGIKKGIGKIDFGAITENLKTVASGFGEILANGLNSAGIIAEAASKTIGTAIEWGIAIGGKGFEIVTQAGAKFITDNKEKIMAWQTETANTMANGFNNATTTISTLGEVVYDSLEAHRDDIANTLAGFGTTVSDAIMLIGTISADTFEIVTGNTADFVTNNKNKIKEFYDNTIEIFTDTGDTINKISQDALGLVKKNWDKYFKGIVDGVSRAALDIYGWFLDLYNKFVKPVVDNMLNWLNEIWSDTLKGIVDEVLGFVGRVGDWLVWLWDNKVKPFVDFFMEYMLPQITNAFNMVVDVIGGVVKLIGDIIKTIIGVINGLIDFVTGVFQGDWEKAWDGVIKAFDSIFSGIKDIAKTAMNIVIDLVNGMLRGLVKGINNVIKMLNGLSFDMPDWLGGGHFGFDFQEITPPQIPRLSKGGVVNDPTLAIIGEAGKEAVMPLENNTGWMMELANMIGMVVANNIGGGSSQANGQGAVYLDGKKVGSIIFDGLTDEAKRRGVNMSVVGV